MSYPGQVTLEQGRQQGAHTYLRRALDEQRAQAESIARFVSALEDQRARLDRQLALALQAFAEAQPEDQGLLTSPYSISNGTPAQDNCRTVVRCLGALEVSVGDARLEGWRSGKARALFEYLVTHRGRAVGRDTLIQALWPDPDALAAGTSLKVAVHALRQVLAERFRGETSPTIVVVGRDSSYELKTTDIWVDVDEFEHCYRLAGQLERSGGTAQALVLYEQAADLYRGDFLADTWDDWVVFRREGLKDQYLFVLARLADAAITAGDYSRCIEFSRRLLDQDTCREDTFRMLMVCHARLGQRGRVRRWYELCVQTLRTMLDVEPDPETTRVYEWAAGSASEWSSLSLARPSGPGV